MIDVEVRTILELKQVPYLYHATYPSRVDSIKEQGIINLYNERGLTYLCDSVESIKEFTHGKFERWRFEMTKGVEVRVVNGEEFSFPKMIVHENVAIFKIDASKLDWDYVYPGDDHNPMFYQSDVYMYGGKIEKDWIQDIIFLPY